MFQYQLAFWPGFLVLHQITLLKMYFLSTLWYKARKQADTYEV
jgi:hypothetical protein